MRMKATLSTLCDVFQAISRCQTKETSSAEKQSNLKCVSYQSAAVFVDCFNLRLIFRRTNNCNCFGHHNLIGTVRMQIHRR